MILGLFGLFSLGMEKANDYLLDNVSITVFYEPQLSEQESISLHGELKNKEYTKSSSYVSSQKALLDYRSDIGEDIVALLGENPLPSSSTFVIEPEYLRDSLMDQLVLELKVLDGVLDVQYIDNLSAFYFAKLGRFKLVIWILLIVLTSLALYVLTGIIALRLSLDKKIISTQFLIGAKPSFIIRPYLLRSFVWSLQGFFLGLSMMLLLLVFLYEWLKSEGFISRQKVVSYFLENWQEYTLLTVLLLLGTSVVIYLSTYIVVRRNIKKLTYDFH